MSNVFGQVASSLTATQKGASRTNLDLDDVTETRVAGIEGDIGNAQSDILDIESKQFGVDQTWQAAELTNTGATFSDGTPSYRAASTTYTNSTGKAIHICVSKNSGGSSRPLIVNGTPIGTINTSLNNQSQTVSIPAGASYQFDATPTFWEEMR